MPATRETPIEDAPLEAPVTVADEAEPERLAVPEAEEPLLADADEPDLPLAVAVAVAALDAAEAVTAARSV